MNREETKEAMKVMEHFVNGGEVEVLNPFGNWQWQWQEGFEPAWDFVESNYRIKKAISDEFMKKVEDVLSQLGDEDEVEFYVPNEQSSKELQDVLFQYGYHWIHGNGIVEHTSKPFLYINSDEEIMCGSGQCQVGREDYIYTIDLKNETITDLRPKTQELTMAQLEEKLGYKIKIVKEN